MRATVGDMMGFLTQRSGSDKELKEESLDARHRVS